LSRLIGTPRLDGCLHLVPGKIVPAMLREFSVRQGQQRSCPSLGSEQKRDLDLPREFVVNSEGMLCNLVYIPISRPGISGGRFPPLARRQTI
jgi:hypothetical protein